MFAWKHDCMQSCLLSSGLVSLPHFQKEVRFRAFVEPKLSPCLLAKFYKHGFRNTKLDGLHGGIVGAHTLGDHIWGDRCRWRLSFQLCKVRGHHATLLSDISAIMSMTLCASVAAFPLSVLNDVSVIALPISDAEPYPVDTGTSPSRTRYPACLRY